MGVRRVCSLASYWSKLHNQLLDGQWCRTFDVFFDLRLTKCLTKQSRHRLFETPSRSLWRHCNDRSPLFAHDASKQMLSVYAVLGAVSLRLMTSQFQVIVNHKEKYQSVKCVFCGVWVQNFVWNFKGHLWNFTQDFEPIHRQICILRGVKNLTSYDILELWHLKS